MSEDHSEAGPVAYYHDGKARYAPHEGSLRVGVLAGVVTFGALSLMAFSQSVVSPSLGVGGAVLIGASITVLVTKLMAKRAETERSENEATYRKEQRLEAEERIKEARASGDFDEWEAK